MKKDILENYADNLPYINMGADEMLLGSFPGEEINDENNG